jgi:fermentation-respiration switch protein FrsA (DUF1100 family)
VTIIDAGRPRRWRARVLTATLAVALAAMGASSTAPAGATTAAPTKAQPPKVAPIGKFAVGKINETFVDQSRSTDANGSDAPALPTRTLPTVIYYPAKGTPTDQPVENAPANAKHGSYPLILFSHGLGAINVVYQDVLKTWASAGYVVAAPDYPLSNHRAVGGVNFGRAVGDTKNQAGDATFVIDQTIKLDKRGTRLGGVDAKRIGASGHSLGGVTTYDFVYSSCCSDKRVKAALPMSGLGGVAESLEQYFVNRQTPLLALHGNRDGTVPYQAGVNTFNKAQPPKYFLTFDGGGHIEPFLGGTDAKAMALKRSTVDFLDHYLKGDKTALEELRTHANVPGETSLVEHPATPRANGRATTKRGSSGG